MDMGDVWYDNQLECSFWSKKAHGFLNDSIISYKNEIAI